VARMMENWGMLQGETAVKIRQFNDVKFVLGME